ncbi:MAG: MFS transporter [Anaerolineae bacterium]|nr:MFS transporter [Anaerolineae bacterium]
MISRSAWVFGGLHFLYFAALSYFIPYVNLYLEDVGLNGSEIGLVRSLPSLVGIVAAPLWGILSDALRLRRGLFIIGAIGAAILMLVTSLVTQLGWLVALGVAHSFMLAIVMPLLTSMTLELLGERRAEYGQMRLWGAVGWGIMAPLAGLIIGAFGLPWIFYGYALLMGISVVLATRLPAVEVSLQDSLGGSLKTLLRCRGLQIFLISVFVVGVGSAVTNNFLILFLEELGGSEALYGLSLTVSTLSEIPVYFFSAPLLRRFGTRPVIICTIALYALYTLLCAQLVNPVWVLAVQLLLGAAFGGLWSAGVAYMAEVAPQGLGATAQSLFSSVFMGLAYAVGAALGGALYDGIGPVSTFRLTGVAIVLGLVFFWVMGRQVEPVC